MNFNKKSAAIFMTTMTTAFLITGCSSGTVGENPPNISSNPITEKYTFKDNEKTFKFVYSNPWRAIDDDEEYPITVIPGENIENANIKLSIKSEDFPQGKSDIAEIAEYYSQFLNTGLVRNDDFTVKNAEGYWISYIPLDNSDSNTQEDEEVTEIGFVVKDSKVYVFKMTAKNYQILQDEKDSVYDLLEGFSFI